jgi:hypothetical protein
MIVAADEEPVLATDRDLAECALGAVVVELEAAVLEEAYERVLLVHRVAEGRAQ